MDDKAIPLLHSQYTMATDDLGTHHAIGGHGIDLVFLE